jgi:hypothetical protein
MNTSGSSSRESPSLPLSSPFICTNKKDKNIWIFKRGSYRRLENIS